MTPQQQQQLLALLQQGLPLAPRPYAWLARQLGLTEQVVLAQINDWRQRDGLFKRFGAVVNHRALGFKANAMVVWDLADEVVDATAQALAKESAITLCYRRRRALPDWPYNLFTMIHGRDRQWVLDTLAAIRQRHKLTHVPCQILFSRRCFRQRGARYLPLPKEVANDHCG